jgi:hypothetical protein
LDSRIEELLKNARAADRIDREREELFGVLVRSPGWQEYVSLIEAKLQMMADAILAPAESVDSLVALEYVKGAMSGLIIARDLPSVTIAAMEQLRQDRIQSSGVEEDDEPA